MRRKRYAEPWLSVRHFAYGLLILAGVGLATYPQNASAEASDMAPTHQQTALIQVVDGQGLNTFCLDHDGNVLAGVGTGPGEIRVYSPAGKLKTLWETKVKTEAINTDPQGNVYVAGDGKVLKYDRNHKLILEADAPHAGAMKADAAGLREQVVQQFQQRTEVYTRQIEVYADQVKRFEKEIATLKAKDELTDADEQRIDVYTRAIDSYQRNIEQFQQYVQQNPAKELTEEQIQQQIAAMVGSKLAVSSISATDDAVFVACRAQEGYGFDVWRTKPDLTEAECIVTGLRGCCGQMDVQASEAGVFVAENSRKRVCRFDSKGEKVCEWGESSAESLEGFGSCCNPMNVAFGPNGEVYTAEATSGRIKRYSPDGTLVGLVGTVEIVPGCKKVSIAVSQDGSRVYMLDITRGHIVVMTRNTDVDVAAANGS